MYRRDFVRPMHFAVKFTFISKVEQQCRPLLLVCFVASLFQKNLLINLNPSFWGVSWNCGPPNGVPHGANKKTGEM